MQITDYFLDFKTLSNDCLSKEYVLSDGFWQMFENSLIPKGTVNARYQIERKVGFFELIICVEGMVQVPCDRCLDDVDIKVKREDRFVVKFAAQDDYGEDIIYINQDDGMLDIATLFYEASALSLPIVVAHEDGKCNPDMIRILKQHEPQAEQHKTDPRWEKLKEIK